MSTKFEWHTGDDIHWDEENHDGNNDRPPRVSWLAVFLIILVLAIVVFFLRFANRQSALAETAVQEEVMSLHQLIQQADDQNDVELFRSVLSGKEKVWTDFQIAHFLHGRLLDRPTFGLMTVPHTTREATITLSPDLRAAELTFTQIYSSSISHKLVAFEQTAVYRRGLNRWLLAPPAPEFWGEEEEITTPSITMKYPQRDRKISRRLAADLQTNLDQFCHEYPNLTCPASGKIQIQLNTNPFWHPGDDEMTAVLRNATVQSDSVLLISAAPSLVGVPLDAAGYDILLQAYTVQLLTAVIAERAGYYCCNHGPFFQTILAKQLDALGIRPWTPHPPDGKTPVHLRNLAVPWQRNSLDAHEDGYWPYFQLTAFFNDHGKAGLELLQAVAQAPEGSYWRVLHQLTNRRYQTRSELETAWLVWSQPETIMSVSPPPAQDLQLLCHPAPVGGMRLYRYRFELGAPAWRYYLGHAEAFMIGLPDDDGVIMAGLPDTETSEETDLLLWQDETATPLSIVRFGLLPVKFISDDVFLVYNRLNRQYIGMSLSGCVNETDCHVGTYAGYPLLTPDGDKAALLVSAGNAGYETRFERPLTIDSVAGEVIETGKSPVWLNNHVLALIQKEGQIITTVTLPELEKTTLLTVADIPGKTIEFITPDSDDPNRLWLVADGQDGRIHLTTFHLQSGNFRHQQSLDLNLRSHVAYDFRFSANNRTLTISGTDETQAETLIYLVNLDDDTIHATQYHAMYDLPLHWLIDWSADGEWLALPDSGYIRLIHPETGQHSFIIPPAAECTAVAWINP